MPVVDIGHGETVSASEFFGAISKHAPLAMQHQKWLYLAKYAFLENNADALMLAKKQAMQIQRGLPVGEPALGTLYPHHQAFPTTYQQPQYQPQPIIFNPTIHVNPTIAPTFTNTANPTNTATANRTKTTNPYAYTEPTDTTLWQWLGFLFATAAIVILIIG
jgi:hypothetical protein